MGPCCSYLSWHPGVLSNLPGGSVRSSNPSWYPYSQQPGTLYSLKLPDILVHSNQVQFKASWYPGILQPGTAKSLLMSWYPATRYRLKLPDILVASNQVQFKTSWYPGSQHPVFVISSNSLFKECHVLFTPVT